MMNNYNAVYVKTIEEAGQILDNYCKLHGHHADYDANIKWNEYYGMYHVTCKWTTATSYD